MTITILGRQPAIGLAELESLYGTDHVRPVGDTAAFIDDAIDFARLGGSVKAGKVLTILETTNPQKVFDYCRRALPQHLGYVPEGKLKLGASLYGLSMPVPKINANVLSLKKVARDSGRSGRAIPNTDPALSSAQTYHNQLTSPLGLELIMIRDGNSTILGQATHVQNINEYTQRDRERPKRDARVGMLPPKLAQTIVNLAVGYATSQESRDTRQETVILDPFCGTGVVLQEAALMGYSVYGSDLEPRMIDYSRTNLEWLASRTQLPLATPKLEVGDATSHVWDFPASIYIACEGYLGTPFANEPPEAALRDSIMTCNLIMKKFLHNLHAQIAPGTRLCIAAPAWQVRGRSHHLACIDSLEDLGYARVSFAYAAPHDLIYRRDDQIVGRELLVLERR